MKIPLKRCALNLLFLLPLMSACDLVASKKGAEPVIESAALTDGNNESNEANAYYGGETPIVVLNLSDEDENIDEIILNVYCDDELKYKLSEDVRQWKNPEEYKVSLKRLENDSGNWTVGVTVEDERGLSAETTVDMIVVNIFDYLTIETPVRARADRVDESDSSLFWSKVCVDYAFENPYSRCIDEVRFDFYLQTIDGQKYCHNVFLGNLDEQRREKFYIKSTQTIDRVFIDTESLVLKVR